ncbi:hypothetical protein DFQ05_0430 [Winogradskyella wandonensis]|uniref:Lipocalin-like protein n=1 Tax=Winogradskyella wandonensis TaxID=1442586 RepID=A0A4R1KW22_9FLAO|nr:hypothetical protein [Winogradskyella wandonensis]TCK68920.1 hypothetical protein DFQ05_0430 [Winogradskyella wandonensis]
MNRTFAACILFVVVATCAQTNNDILGEWTLKSWSVGSESTLVNNNKQSTNLLDITTCNNSEVLTVKANNTIGATNTFNPNIKISKGENGYLVTEVCTKGSLGFSNSFKLIDNKLVLDIGDSYIIKEDSLSRTFKNYIKVYNSDFTQVIERKDLILVYIRR